MISCMLFNLFDRFSQVSTFENLDHSKGSVKAKGEREREREREQDKKTEKEREKVRLTWPFKQGQDISGNPLMF